MFLVYLLLTITQATSHVPAVDASDLDRFPSGGIPTYIGGGPPEYRTSWVRTDAVQKWRDDAEEHWKFCRAQLDMRLSPWIDWHTLEREAFRTYTAWDLLEEANRFRGSDFCRGWMLMDLGELRRILGDDYLVGVMPIPQTWHLDFIP